MQAVARARTTPGRFVALFGVEYTVASPVHDGCEPGEAQCGGHKLAVCPQVDVQSRCDHTASDDQACASEADFYEFVHEHACVGVAAHPCGNIPADFSPAVEDGGGFDAEAVPAYSFSPLCEGRITSRERLVASLSPASFERTSGMPLRPFALWNDPRGFVRTLRTDERERHSYNDALRQGHRIGVVYGSDTHNRPTPAPAGVGCGQGWVPGTTPRSVCWADALTADGVLDAIRERRCYYARAERPVVRFSIEGRPMGSIVPAASLDARGSVRLAVDAEGGERVRFAEFDLVHDGRALLRGVPCESERCEYDAAVRAPDPRGYWYLRIRGDERIGVVTSPIWIE